MLKIKETNNRDRERKGVDGRRKKMTKKKAKVKVGKGKTKTRGKKSAKGPGNSRWRGIPKNQGGPGVEEDRGCFSFTAEQKRGRNEKTPTAGTGRGEGLGKKGQIPLQLKWRSSDEGTGRGSLPGQMDPHKVKGGRKIRREGDLSRGRARRGGGGGGVHPATEVLT